MPDEAPRLELRGITKRFPGCLANDGIDLSLGAGEIHALLGENGAGKSTLVKIVYGVLKADSGEILWDGRPAGIASPAQARRLGIGLVFQHFSLFDSLTVAENIALGMGEALPMRALADRIAEISARYGLTLDPGRPVYSLSVGERQRVEIVRCLLQNPRLLIMDEPTSVLTPLEAERLFETLRQVAAEGRTVLYISHKLDEIRALCERATVLRNGRVVATCDPRTETAHSLAEMMIGSELTTPEHGGAEGGAVRLTVGGLTLHSDHVHGIDLKKIRFAVKSGEIFGIAGVAGNGQTELLEALTGERRADHDTIIRLDDRPVARLGPRSRRRLGMGFVPEERLGRGAVADMTLAENALLGGYGSMDLLSHGMIKTADTDSYAARIIERFNVVAGGPSAQARSLSGGNLQKFIIGREVLRSPAVLVASQPTWGVDAGAMAAIHQSLIDLAKSGSAVLVISQDLDEILAISDRMAVMCNGRLSDSHKTADMTVEQAGLLMGGLFDEEAQGTA